MTYKPEFRVRAIFSDKALMQLDYDQPIMATDKSSGITLAYRFNPHAGGSLMFTGGGLPAPIRVGVDSNDINLIATLIIDGLKHQ